MTLASHLLVLVLLVCTYMHSRTVVLLLGMSLRNALEALSGCFLGSASAVKCLYIRVEDGIHNIRILSYY